MTRKRSHYSRVRRRIIVATILVPALAFFILLLLMAVLSAASNKAQGVIKKLDAVDDIMGYLYRDEQRELALRGR